MLVLDLVNPTELNGYIRGLAVEEERNRFALSEYLPVETINDVEFRITQGNLLDVDAGMYRALDAEAPIGKRQGGTRISGTIPPLSQKLKLGEEERLRLRAARTRDQSELVAQVYDDAGITTRALLARIELARGEALANGTLSISENGLEAEIDYGRNPDHTVTAGVLWSNFSGSDPITDFANWTEAYNDTNGIDPGFWLVSKSVVSNMLRNDKIQSVVTQPAGVPALLRKAELNRILEDYGVAPLVEYNTKIRVRGVQQPVLPTDRVIAMPPPGEPLGNVLSGVTAEALELADAGFLTQEQEAGLTTVVMKQFDPVGRWTKTAGMLLPVLANPDLTFSAEVL